MAAIGKDKIDETIRLAFEGQTGAAIAAHWGITRQGVCEFLRSEEAQTRLAAMRAEHDSVVARLSAAGVGAALEFHVDVVKGMHADATIAERARSADSLLDRWGKARNNKSELTGKDGAPLTIRFDLSGLSEADLDAAEKKIRGD